MNGQPLMASSGSSDDARALFGAELSSRVPPTHLVLKPITALGHTTVADRLFVHQYAHEASQAITARLDSTSVQESRWAAEVVVQFQLGQPGCLHRLCTAHDDQLTKAVHIAIWEALERRMRFAMEEILSTQDRSDAAQQLYLERAVRWTELYDPREGSFDTFLKHRLRPKELSAKGQRTLGLGTPREVLTDFTDTKNDRPDLSGSEQDEADSRIDAHARISLGVGPPSLWPEEVRLTHERGMTPTEIGKVQGRTPGAVRASLSRFYKKCQGKCGGG